MRSQEHFFFFLGMANQRCLSYSEYAQQHCLKKVLVIDSFSDYKGSIQFEYNFSFSYCSVHSKDLGFTNVFKYTIEFETVNKDILEFKCKLIDVPLVL